MIPLFQPTNHSIQNGNLTENLLTEQTTKLVEMLKNPPKEEEAFLLDLMTNRVPPVGG
jgi:aconitate hydratase 2/2-methylisocitrate dehydratase